MNKTQILEVQAEGLNETNIYMETVLNEIMPQLNPFMGKRVVTADGNLFSKFKIESEHKIYEKRDGDKLTRYQFWVNPTRNTLKLETRIMICGGPDGNHYTQYFDRSIYQIATITDKVLTGIESTKQLIASAKLSKRYTADQLQNDINEFNQAKETLREARFKIPQSVFTLMNLSEH